MKTQTLLLALVLGAVACHKNNNGGTPMPNAGNFAQTNLVADTPSYGAAILDPTLKNAWGLALNPGADILWIAANHSGATNVYDLTGKTLLGPIPIPSMGDQNGGSPTGVAFNPTADFIIPVIGGTAKFVFANEDGTISAWAPVGAVTTTVIDKSSFDAVYKGCTFASQGGNTYLYAANFGENAIDIFDKNWKDVEGFAFKDPAIPTGFGPFNIASIGGMLYITYAKHDSNSDDDAPAPGNGYVDIFSTDGKLVKSFASQGPLNSPWGITQAPDGSGLPLHSIVVGNFGDGMINVYDSTGVYKGALQNGGKPLIIEGLWALDFLHNDDAKHDPAQLWFTAGPKGEQHGLLGFLKKQ